MQALHGAFLSNHKPRSVLSEQSRELDPPAGMTATDEVGRKGWFCTEIGLALCYLKEHTMSTVKATTGASLLLGTTPASQIDPNGTLSTAGANRPGMTNVKLTHDQKAALVGEAALKALKHDPDLFDKDIDTVARLMGVPPSTLRKAFADLSDKNGVPLKLTREDGSPRTLKDIFQSIPGDIAGKKLTDWFNKQPKALRQALTGLGVGVLVATRGLEGLNGQGINVTVVKTNRIKFDGSTGIDNGNVYVRVSGTYTVLLTKSSTLVIVGGVGNHSKDVHAVLNLGLGTNNHLSVVGGTPGGGSIAANLNVNW
jgi:hypothetical protein